MLHAIQNYKRIVAGLGLATMLTVSMAAPALAAETDMEVGITGTPRTVGIGALVFEDSALEFSLGAQTVTTDGVETGSPAVLTVTDMSGTGAAWTTYAETSGLTSGSDTIPGSAITVTPSNLQTADGATLGTGGTLGTQQVVLTALADAGDGTHTVDLDLTIAVPGSQKAGTYTGALIVTDVADIP